MNSPFSPEQLAQLKEPLDPKRIKHRQGGGGMQLSYIKGHDAIDTANHIFGWGQWGYDILGVELQNISGEDGAVIGSYYWARVRLTVAACIPITEEGVGPVQEGRNPRAKIDAHDMARKGAVTDALKRALRCYGDQFGNSLYDTEHTSTSNSQPAPARQQQGQRQAGQAQTRAAAPAPAPAPAAASNQGDFAPATEQQVNAIRKICQRRQISPIELDNFLTGHGLGCLIDLTVGEASYAIKILQQQQQQQNG